MLSNKDYKMRGNLISVKTLNLDYDFPMTRKQLDKIAIKD